jgi:hypothetical protein
LPCPYFMPTEKLENGVWPHPARLPLGAGWSGCCTAPGYEGEIPEQSVLEKFCNLGYSTCDHRPLDREATAWDAIRFSARLIQKKSSADTTFTTSIANDPILQIRYVCERDHRPAGQGLINFDARSLACHEPHSNPRIQKMAECFLESYLSSRHKKEETA